MSKLVGRSLMRSTVSNYFLTNFLTLQRENSDYIIKKSDELYLNQVIHINIINIGTNQHNVPSDMIIIKEKNTTRKHQTEKPKLKNILQNNPFSTNTNVCVCAHLCVSRPRKKSESKELLVKQTNRCQRGIITEFNVWSFNRILDWQGKGGKGIKHITGTLVYIWVCNVDQIIILYQC